MKEPKRLQSIVESKQTEQPKESKQSVKSTLPRDVEIDLPELELNLAFFLQKGDQPFTVESLLQQVFGDDAKRYTTAEQMYVILNALRKMEIIAPIPFECPHCQAENPVAVDLPNVMKKHGTSLQEFHIEMSKYIFKFVRPETIQDTSKMASPTASIGLFMLQWLDAHNQGDDFDITKIPLHEFLDLVKLFGEKMMGTSFNVKTKCAKCKKPFETDFEVTLPDLVDILNEI